MTASLLKDEDRETPGGGDAPAHDRRRTEHRWLLLALAIASFRDDAQQRRMPPAWFDSWTGVRHAVDAMHAEGYNVRLMRLPFVWWAEFRRDEGNPLPRWLGVAAGAPWRAVQRAALKTVRQDWNST